MAIRRYKVFTGGQTPVRSNLRILFAHICSKKTITEPNQVWCSDITYIPMKHGFLYLVAIMDWATRKVLTWRPSNTLNASFCAEVLEEVIAKYNRSEMMNTDQGSQYTGTAWITTLTEAGIRIARVDIWTTTVSLNVYGGH